MKKILIVAMLLLGACAGKQEKKELKSPLEVLNGKVYGVREDSTMPTIPATGTKNQITRVRGALMLGEGVSATPLKHTKVRMLDDDGVTVGEATSDLQGKFRFSDIYFNGHYTVEITSPKYKGATRIYINSYDQEVVVVATPL
ncbi:carboxypeptidase-like regulatory domain-containing protein [Bdellovibrio sp. GT3]|uniref:carboxypeptidase-like regulatory domain-containing protein n=1 Tax=Bdellovibrio sp. GT3 TaxID=3136282 RepID=UPI0030F301E1